jgi:hypothetical protein
MAATYHGKMMRPDGRDIRDVKRDLIRRKRRKEAEEKEQRDRR